MNASLPESKNNTKLGAENINVADKESFKHYLYFWSAQRFSILGSAVVQFVIIWWITLTTESELLLGLASLIGFGPMVLLAPFAGVLADRFNRKIIIIISDVLQGVAALVMIILFMTNNATLLGVFLLLGIRACFAPFHSTTVSAIIPTMVPKDKLSRMNGLNYFTNGIIAVIGPVIGALLLSFLNIGLVLWIDIITLVIAIVPLFFIIIPSPEKTDRLEVKTVFSDISDGVRTLKKIDGLIALLIIFSVCNFFINPYMTLLSLFVEKNHLGTETDYALVTSLLQVGIIVGGLFMVLFRGFKKRNLLVCYLSIMWAFGFLQFLPWVPTGTFWLMGVVFLVSTLTVPIINVQINTVFQVLIPQDKFGRVSAALGTITSAITPLAMLLSGVIGELIGIKLVYILTGAIAIVLINILWFVTPVRKLDKVIDKRFQEIEEMKATATLAEEQKKREATEEQFIDKKETTTFTSDYPTGGNPSLD
jgi:DHA3 family macrolide efflux protein-like MFS transporter